jgi:ketosteroid isomerase-like protein
MSINRHKAIASGYEAFNRGDLAGAIRHLHPHVEWIEPEEFVGGGSYRGHAGVIEYLGRARSQWAWIESTPMQMVDVDADKVVVVVRTRMRSHGDEKSFERLIADVYTFDDAGIVHMQAFSDPAEAFAVVGLEPSS